MASRAGQSQSQCVKSCSLRWHYRQIGCIAGSRWWRYWFREGWWADHNLASSTLSCWFLICLESPEPLWCWYICATWLWIGGLSRILLLITCRELEKDTGRMVCVTMEVASLVALLPSSLPGISECPGIHWIKMDEEMELMDWWMKDVWSCNLYFRFTFLAFLVLTSFFLLSYPEQIAYLSSNQFSSVFFNANQVSYVGFLFFSFSDPNLHKKCVWFLDGAPSHEILRKISFVIKSFKKRLNRGCWHFKCTFFCKKCPFLLISDAAPVF